MYGAIGSIGGYGGAGRAKVHCAAVNGDGARRAVCLVGEEQQLLGPRDARVAHRAGVATPEPVHQASPPRESLLYKVEHYECDCGAKNPLFTRTTRGNRRGRIG